MIPSLIGGLALFVVACGGSSRPSPEQLARGEALYLRGELASGELVKGTVLGDVPIQGAQAPCASCHGRSGMGTEETGDRTPSIAAPLLFAVDAQTKRPAYTDETLGRAIREGRDSAGEPLDALMPKYELADDDLAALTAYLRQLGVGDAPGSDDDNLWLATVVAGDVDPDAKKQMIDVLEAWVEAKNGISRNESERAYARRETDRTFKPWRIWHLEVWNLDGAPETWGAQLEKRYAAKAPFALISGLADGPWTPIHTFCEDQRLPCILPNTELPPEEAGGFYTMYFSGGMGLEARVVAADLARREVTGPVVQFVGGSALAAEASKALAAAAEVKTVDLARGVDALTSALDDAGNAAVVAWLTPDEWSKVGDLTAATGDAPLPEVYVSGTLFRDAGAAPPASSRVSEVRLFRRVDELDPGLKRFRAWSVPRKVAIAEDPRLQAQTWFACMTVMMGAKHLERYPVREYLLDRLDHAAGLSAFLPIYPRGVFGPGQRRIAKGGYVIDPSGAEEPRWVVP